jgi:hypothetical protein
MTVALKTRTAAFLEALAADIELELSYDRDPAKVMTEFGLSDDEQNVILHGTIAEIREAVGQTEAFLIKKHSPPHGPVVA